MNVRCYIIAIFSLLSSFRVWAKNPCAHLYLIMEERVNQELSSNNKLCKKAQKIDLLACQCYFLFLTNISQYTQNQVIKRSYIISFSAADGNLFPYSYITDNRLEQVRENLVFRFRFMLSFKLMIVTNTKKNAQIKESFLYNNVCVY